MLTERRLHRTWGPKKIQDILLKKHGVEAPPACGTIGEMLRRHGLSVRRRRRPGAYYQANTELTVPTQPNHVWTESVYTQRATRRTVRVRRSAS